MTDDYADRAIGEGVDVEGATPTVEWRCFHCDEVFTDKAEAAAHFGHDECREAGCVERLTKDEKALRAEIVEARRTAEGACSAMQRSDEEACAALSTIPAFLLRFKDKPKSLNDVFFLYDSMEGRALAAEEQLAAAKEKERDALRYRWLRGDLPTKAIFITPWGRSNRLPHIAQYPQGDGEQPKVQWVFKTGAQCGVDREKLDAVIDAALATEPGERHG